MLNEMSQSGTDIEWWHSFVIYRKKNYSVRAIPKYIRNAEWKVQLRQRRDTMTIIYGNLHSEQGGTEKKYIYILIQCCVANHIGEKARKMKRELSAMKSD